jgi:excisionase family DNA binding protein
MDVEGDRAPCLLPATESERIMNKPLLRVEEAAQVLAVSRWTIYRWVEQGRLEGTKIGRGSLRIFSRSIEKLVEQNRTDDMPSGLFVHGGELSPVGAAIQ